MPGIVTRTDVRTGPSSLDDEAAAAFFVVGQTERGRSDDAVLVRNLSEYRNAFGERVSYSTIYDQIETFFEEGGSRAWVGRVVGPAAVSGSVVLNDRAAIPTGVLKLTARGPGDWSSSMDVTVLDSEQEGYFTLVISFNGDVVEVFTAPSVPSAVGLINSTSIYLAAAAEANVTAAPDNIPALINNAPLSAGNDDRATIVAVDYVNTLELFTGLGIGFVAIPGQNASIVAGGIAAHCKAQRRVAGLAPASAQTVGAVITLASTIRATTNDEDHLGLFYPWVDIPGLDGIGSVRSISPEGYIAATRARAVLEDGPWRAGAGDLSQARFVLGPSTPLTTAEGNALNDAGVSAIRTIARTTRVYGWRSLSPDEKNWALLTQRDTINFIVVEAERRLERYVFRTIDGRGLLFAEINADMIAMLDPIRAAGGIYESEDDLGYSVDTGPSVNTVQTIARNEANVAIGARVSPTGATIGLLVTKAGIGAAV